jgi:hypothetical protein
VAGAGEDRDPRVAGVGGVGPRAPAEGEDRAPRVGDELLVAAAVAEPVDELLGHRGRSYAFPGNCGPGRRDAASATASFGL